MEKRILVVEDILDFRLRWSIEAVPDGRPPPYVQVEVFSICGWAGDEGKELYFLKRDWVSSDETVNSIDEAELYLTASMKWDGCTNFDWGRGADHFCGVHDFANHAALMRYLWDHAFTLMGQPLPAVWPEAH